MMMMVIILIITLKKSKKALLWIAEVLLKLISHFPEYEKKYGYEIVEDVLTQTRWKKVLYIDVPVI